MLQASIGLLDEVGRFVMNRKRLRKEVSVIPRKTKVASSPWLQTWMALTNCDPLAQRIGPFSPLQGLVPHRYNLLLCLLLQCPNHEISPESDFIDTALNLALMRNESAVGILLGSAKADVKYDQLLPKAALVSSPECLRLLERKCFSSSSSITTVGQGLLGGNEILLGGPKVPESTWGSTAHLVGNLGNSQSRRRMRRQSWSGPVHSIHHGDFRPAASNDALLDLVSIKSLDE